MKKLISSIVIAVAFVALAVGNGMFVSETSSEDVSLNALSMNGTVANAEWEAPVPPKYHCWTSRQYTPDYTVRICNSLCPGLEGVGKGMDGYCVAK